MPPKSDKDKKQPHGEGGEVGKQEKDAILIRLEEKINQILAQNMEVKNSIANINTEITNVKASLQSMDTTVEQLKMDIDDKVDKKAFEKYQVQVSRKIDDLMNRSMRNNIVFWGIPERAEAGIGLRNLIYNIFDKQLELNDARNIVIERVHRTTIRLPDGSVLNPRPIYMKILNWEDKEYLLKISPSRLKRNSFGFGANAVKIYISDDVSKKVRDDRKLFRQRYLKDIQQKQGVKVAFVPFLVPARIQYKEGDTWKYFFLPEP